MTAHTTKTCKKCGGTGRLAWTAVDGGRCWACTGKADTSYSSDLRAHEEYVAQWEAARATARAARRAARTAT